MYLIRRSKNGLLGDFVKAGRPCTIRVYEEIEQAQRAISQIKEREFKKGNTLLVVSIDSFSTVARFEPQKEESEFLVPKAPKLYEEE